MDWITKEPTVWEYLQTAEQPIVLYGMGDGADKILNVCAARQIPIAGVFASDDFVRGHSFAGFPVKKLSDLIADLGQEPVILIAFASQRPELLERFAALDEKYDVFAPDVPVAGGGLFDREWLLAHRDEFAAAYDLMADEASRRCYADIINFKLTGRMKYLRACESGKDEIFETVLRPGAEEHFVDLGAYNGDTIRELLSYTDGSYASITAFEPDGKTFRKLRAYARDNLTGAVELVKACAWSEDGVRTFAARAGRNSRLGTGGIETEVRAVDSVLQGRPCTLLKLDVEGAERKALLGAAQTIAKYHPAMNLACYHRNEDLYDLPLLVHSLCADYRLYLRHHPYVPAWDVNLYAAVK